MKELLWWIVEKLLGKDVLHYKVNIQIGLLVIFVVLSGWAAWHAHSFYWQWNEINRAAESIPETTSNIVQSVVENDFSTKINTIEQGVIQAQKNESIISHQLQEMQVEARQRDRKIDRINDYLFDKMGTKLDFILQQQTNKFAFEP